MSTIFARPISCKHNSEIKYDPEDVIPKYVCGCDAVVLTRKLYVPPDDESLISSSFTMPLHSTIRGNMNLGDVITVGGWGINERVRVVVSYAVCYYHPDELRNQLENLAGYYVYCGRCYSAFENEEGDFAPYWNEDGLNTGLTLPEPVCVLEVEYEDEVNDRGQLFLQVEHRPGHVLATEAGIDDGLELARSLDTVYDVTFSRECFCRHCHCSIMQCSYI